MNNNKTTLRSIALFILLLMIWGFLAMPLAAHTAGKLQLSAVAAGPYQLTVWTSPDPATTGELHVALSVVLAQDASPILDATVMVELTSLEDGSIISGQATTEDSENKFLYEAILAPDAPGEYQVGIMVAGDNGAAGDVVFGLDIVDDPGFDPLYLIPIGLVLAAIVLYGFSRWNSHGTNEDARK